MKYQIRDSTVTFTNKSVQIENVTSWKWYLDSGSGFVQVGTGAVTQDITFPDSGGTLCTVRLVAAGTWGSDVVFEQQYTTVDDVPVPVIVAPTSWTSGSIYNGVPESGHYFTVEGGTGAGDLTYSIDAGVSGMTIDADTGELSGIPWGYGMSGVWATPGSIIFRVIVTDALMRQSYYDCTKVMLPFVMGFLEADYGVTKDGGNKVSKVQNRAAFDSYLEMTTPGNQPVWSASIDGKPAILFNPINSERMQFVNFGSTTTHYHGSIHVLKINTQDAVSRAVFTMNNSLGGLFVKENGALIVPAVNSGGFIYFAAGSLPKRVIYLGLNNHSNITLGSFIENGVQRGAKATTWALGGGYPHYIGYDGTNLCANMYWHCSIFFCGSNTNSAMVTDVNPVGSIALVNRILQYLSSKYTIPCKKFTATV